MACILARLQPQPEELQAEVRHLDSQLGTAQSHRADLEADKAQLVDELGAIDSSAEIEVGQQGMRQLEDASAGAESRTAAAKQEGLRLRGVLEAVNEEISKVTNLILETKALADAAGPTELRAKQAEADEWKGRAQSLEVGLTEVRQEDERSSADSDSGIKLAFIVADSL